MFCVGLTGTIASGKSTVTELFKNHGAVIISADVAARELTQVNQPALMAIEKHFGKSIIKPTGELDRKALRAKIFGDSEQRRWLEQLLHPLIRQLMQNKLKECTGPYALLEIPLLKTREDYPDLDRVLLVVTHSERAIERIILRDQCSREEAEAILAIQINEAINRVEIVDDLIENDSTITALAKKVEKLHQLYLQFASQKS
ncbi:MAG: dephospho-CoA kinase [Tatlockia sp.]|nr:dephospho-CoA kinase [Tatlockia sp.]